MNECWFFGAWSPDQKGHYLYDCHGQSVYRGVEEMPCTSTPDGVFLGKLDLIYKPRIWNTDGWTVYTMWDRSGDSRSGSSSTFIIKGEVNAEDAWRIIIEKFPKIAQRISDARMKR